MPLSTPRAHTSSAALRPAPSDVSTTFRSKDNGKQRNAHHPPVTDALVASTLTWTILELEEHLIPAQGAGDVLYVYTGDIVVTHDIRRTLDVFEGDVNEAIDNIRTFVIEGILGSPGTTR